MRNLNKTHLEHEDYDPAQHWPAPPLRDSWSPSLIVSAMSKTDVVGKKRVLERMQHNKGNHPHA